MPGKRLQFDDETWQAIEAVARQSDRSFQELADEAFAEGAGMRLVVFALGVLVISSIIVAIAALVL
jgi:hypothetical protein